MVNDQIEGLVDLHGKVKNTSPVLVCLTLITMD